MTKRQSVLMNTDKKYRDKGQKTKNKDWHIIGVFVRSKKLMFNN